MGRDRPCHPSGSSGIPGQGRASGRVSVLRPILGGCLGRTACPAKPAGSLQESHHQFIQGELPQIQLCQALQSEIKHSRATCVRRKTGQPCCQNQTNPRRRVELQTIRGAEPGEPESPPNLTIARDVGGPRTTATKTIRAMTVPRLPASYRLQNGILQFRLENTSNYSKQLEGRPADKPLASTPVAMQGFISSGLCTHNTGNLMRLLEGYLGALKS